MTSMFIITFTIVMDLNLMSSINYALISIVNPFCLYPINYPIAIAIAIDYPPMVFSLIPPLYVTL